MANYSDIHLDTLFSALADPTRRAIVQQLSNGSKLSVSELHGGHDMALPSFMQHLKVLEDAGLIASEKIGRTRMVQVKPKPLSKIQHWLEQQQTLWEARFDRLADLVETKDDFQ